MDDAMGLRLGAVIGDIGTGFAIDHALRIAEAVAPGGKVFCVDVKQSVIAKIKDQADARHIKNVEAVLGVDDDPKLPPMTFDAILISNTYHEFTQPTAMMEHIREALKPGGTLVVVENCSIAHRSDSRAEQTKLHDIAPDILERELSAEGFVVKERIDPILVETAEPRVSLSNLVTTIGRLAAARSTTLTNSKDFASLAGRRQRPVSVPHHRPRSFSRSVRIAPSFGDSH
jgi:ubiquinone/menaquinone biosynthesis C-methylase UbiE